MLKIRLIFIMCLCVIPFAAFCKDDEPASIAADVTADAVLHKNANILNAMQVIESVGIAELRISEQRQPVERGGNVMKGATLLTGLHASVSCSLADDSVITMNQLGKLTFLGGTQTDKSLEYHIAADSGFIIINAKPRDTTDVIINVTTSVGTLICRNFTGQIYIGSDRGVLVTAAAGNVKVKPKIKTFYTLRKGGMCAITKDGYLIDNDKLIRGKISFMPSNVTDAQSVSLFINRVCDAYTKDRYTNDYFDQRHK